MKALVYTAPHQTTFQDVPTPTLQAGESLIEVKAAGICGSDMHAWHGHDSRRNPPLILGHEMAGRVIEGAHKGKKVTVNPLITCGHCVFCTSGRDNLCCNRTMIGMTRPGSFAQYLTIPAKCVIPFAEAVSYTIASLCEPTAVCLHAVKLAKKLPNLCALEDQKCLVIGAGAIGLITALILQHFGVKDITISETSEQRLKMAQASVNCTALNPLKDTLEANTYHQVFDAVGSHATRTSTMQCVHAGGGVIHIGLQQGEGTFDARRLTLAEITFAGVYTYTMLEMREALDLLTHHAISDYQWIQERPLAEGQQGFKDIHSGQIDAAKITLLPH